MNRAKEIREKLAFIGRYMDSISPKLSKYQELEKEKELLRKELKTLGDNTSGVNPEKKKKHYFGGKQYQDMAVKPMPDPVFLEQVGGGKKSNRSWIFHKS